MTCTTPVPRLPVVERPLPRWGYTQSRACRHRWWTFVIVFVWCGLFTERSHATELQSASRTGSDRSAPIMLVPEQSPAAIPVSPDHSTVFRRLSSGQGMSQARVGWIAQDHLGFLWFATQYGLNRFDGYEYKVFRKNPKNPNSLGCAYVRLVYVDHTGTLWAACDRSIERYDPKTEAFRHFPLQTGDMNRAAAVPTTILEDSRGSLWVATHNGLFKLSSTGSFERFGHVEGDSGSLQSDDHGDMDSDNHGSFLLLDDNSLIERFDPLQGRVTERIGVSGSRIRFNFHIDRWDRIWIMGLSSDCLLGQADLIHGTLHCSSLQLAKGPASGVLHIYGMADGVDHDVWLATAGAGLIHVRPGKATGEQAFHVAADTSSLSTDTILFAFRDREGNYWCAHQEGGVDTFSGTPLPIHPLSAERGDIAGSLVTSIYKDSRGTVWIGSTGALNRMASDGTNLVPKGVGSHGEILSIIEDEQGKLISGTYHDGIIGIDSATGQFKPLPHISDNPDILKRDTRRLLLDRQGNLWAAMRGGLGLVDRISGKLTLFSPSSTLNFPAADVKEDREEILWIASESGMHRFDPVSKTFRSYQHQDDRDDSLSDDHVNYLFVDHDDNLWAGTQNGLDRFDRSTQTFRSFSDKDGMAGNVASCILEDERHHLWIGTNQGLSEFDSATGRFENYSVVDGLPGPDLTGWASCYRGADGTMYFGGFSGAIYFKPQDLKANPTPVAVTFTKLVVNGHDVSATDPVLHGSDITYSQQLVLPHNLNSFSVEFSALSFHDPSAIRYRYRLVGLSDQWRPMDSRQRVATFTTLPTGHYVLEVQAAGSHGQWGPSATLRVNIPPTFWETWFFKAIALMACVAAVVIVFWLRLEVAKFRLKERMEAGSAERERIARELHDSFFPAVHGLFLRISTATLGLPKESVQRASIENAFLLSDSVMEEGRRLISDLRQADELCTPEDALRAFIAEFQRDSKLEMTVTSTGDVMEINPMANAEILQIAREAVRNAVKHATASKVIVNIDYAKRQLSLCIDDDGSGIAPELIQRGYRDGHFGLLGMRERALRLKARFEIRRSHLGGTCVCLVVPSSIAYVSKLELWTRHWMHLRAARH